MVGDPVALGHMKPDLAAAGDHHGRMNDELAGFAGGENMGEGPLVGKAQQFASVGPVKDLVGMHQRRFPGGPPRALRSPLRASRTDLAWAAARLALVSGDF